MEFVWDLIVFVHLLGMAAVVGGWLMQLRAAAPQVPAAVVYGAAVQVISGPALVGLASSGAVDHDVNNTKIGVKLLIALAVFVVAYLGRQRGDGAAAAPAMAGAPVADGAAPVAAGRLTGRTALHVAGGLAFVNVLIAVFWG
ncbi:hypothetical protein I6A84_17895 [Frankia sp. CNm7]|uniref:Uncharacterized protein n=1 Tax=Frankia nepalensis TaxID=1836974 RepID=A0A937RPC9_9ACTN|nr:hypothetical protein [Frankia nepalensis]MBL7499355.1 hypothetical protein [Frankia nepalensis]MBL7514113.1 hypothetical protein [Frankia nepalensis]MBL7519914.1 hypothetical protein [Frankia nepalensis]MBL7632464.1 hypothetical protein [Frankia nepalensis]